MARKSSIPDDILQYKPCKCTKVRDDNGTYRVYKYSAVKLPSGKWGTDSGYLIGKIIPGKGFVANKRYKKELESDARLPFVDEITDVAYGQYALLLHLSSDILEMLEDCFPGERAAQIYSYAVIMCAFGFTHIDQIDEYYRESILSIKYKDYSFKMGYKALSSLLHDLGMMTNPVRSFEQKLIDGSSRNIAIDGHVIRSCSAGNDLAERGYKTGQLKSPQVNLIIAYDIKSRIPLLYRTFRGSSVDKRSVVEILESRTFSNVKFVVDNGFFSPDALRLMSENGNCYIIPLANSNKNVKRIKKSLQYTSGEFIYKPDRKTSARVVYYEERLDDSTRIIVFKDMDENNSKRKSYKQSMLEGQSSCSQEQYDELCEWWGVYFLQTTSDEDAPDVYSDYKGRWSIETFNNYIKNDACFNGLKIQDYYIQHGFDFIMLVTGLIHSKLNDAVRNLKQPDISTFDVLLKAGHMRMVLNEDEWHLHNTRTKDIELFSSMGFVPQKVYSG